MGGDTMDIKFYFLKDGTRTYDKTDLITYFQANPNVTVEKKGEEKIFHYHHPILNFDARFCMMSKSVVPNLERLNPKFYDVNFYFEFNVIIPTYFAEMIFTEVVSFRRSMVIKTFEAWKNAYKVKEEDEIATYNRLDPQTLAQIYNYLISKPNLEIRYDKSKIQITNYFFLHATKSRSAFVAIKWDGETSFILPPAVDMIYLEDGKNSKYYSLAEIMAHGGKKLFKPIDGAGVVQYLDAKNTKKLRKILSKKDWFSPLYVELSPLSLDKILDI